MQRQETFLRDLGEGLIMRRATPADADALTAFNEMIHRYPGQEEPDIYAGNWTRALLTRPHPTFSPGDFIIVEDAQTGKIVSSTNLISQTWTYRNIPFGVGRPEMVGTLAEYRRRGLVRAQFEVLHQWSAERGEMAQVISGIPNYYRQFGYEMCLSLSGWRVGYNVHIPRLPEGEPEPFKIRPAADFDLPFIAALYEFANQRYVVACARDETLWRHELSGTVERSPSRRELRIIATDDHEPVGYLVHSDSLWDKAGMFATAYEVKPGFSWLAVTPTVIRYLESVGNAYAERDTTDKQKPAFTAFGFQLGEDHPVYHVLKERLPRAQKPYAYYVRVPDLPAFIMQIAPALEQRLFATVIDGITADLKISFYKSGLRIILEKGKFVAVEPWQPAHSEDGDAQFPDLTFLHVLFCNRTLDELSYIFPDCGCNSEAKVILETLFPKQKSHIWPVG